MSQSSINRRNALVASAGVMLAAAAPTLALAESKGSMDIDPGVTVSPEDVKEIWEVMDKYLDYFHLPLADTIDEDLKTMLFPHVRIASHQVVGFPDAKSYKDVSLNQTGDFLPAGWDHSEWAKRRIVEADKEKVHVVTTFNRLRKDNSLIADENSLYILEKVNGHWGIRGRSSFAK